MVPVHGQHKIRGVSEDSKEEEEGKEVVKDQDSYTVRLRRHPFSSLHPLSSTELENQNL